MSYLYLRPYVEINGERLYLISKKEQPFDTNTIINHKPKKLFGVYKKPFVKIQELWINGKPIPTAWYPQNKNRPPDKILEAFVWPHKIILPILLTIDTKIELLDFKSNQIADIVQDYSVV